MNQAENISKTTKLLLVLAITLLSACTSPYTRVNEALFTDVESIAQRGNPKAQYMVGMMYNNGIGVSQDPQKALEWFRKATDAGDPLGAYKLGCYYSGQFDVVEVDLAKALEYKLVAAKAGYDLAQHDVGIHYFEKGDYGEAIKWWKMSAEQGYPMALYNLSVAYNEGKCVPKDTALVYAYFKLAKLASEKRVSKEAQATLDELAANMSSTERAKAEGIVSNWESRPTELTMRSRDGFGEAMAIAREAKR